MRKRTVKQIIKKKIQIHRDEKNNIINKIKKPINKMYFPDRLSKSVKSQEERNKIPLRQNKPVKKVFKPLVFKNFPPYVKKEKVDYDVIIAISSFNRFEKVKRLINQILEQETKYSFKILFMNDGSTIGKYNIFKYKKEIKYFQNNVNGGKFKYWETITKLWNEVKKYKTHALLQIDDDFLLCNNFIDKLMDNFFQLKEKNSQYCGIRYHIGDYNSINKHYAVYGNDMQSVDGGTLYDIDFIEYLNYSIKEQRVSSKYDHTRVWTYVSGKIREYGGRIFVCKESFAYHDGNEDSKHNPLGRKNMKIITKQYIGDNLEKAFEKNNEK